MRHDQLVRARDRRERLRDAAHPGIQRRAVRRGAASAERPRAATMSMATFRLASRPRWPCARAGVLMRVNAPRRAGHDLRQSARTARA
jgi:hypothetical protein